jgi:hypothetical protein
MLIADNQNLRPAYWAHKRVSLSMAKRKKKIKSKQKDLKRAQQAAENASNLRPVRCM